jgi:hypothetical protein
MGLSTVLGLARQGFFIPYRYAGSVPDTPPRYDAYEDLLHGAAPSMRELLTWAQGQAPALAAFGGPAPAPPGRGRDGRRNGFRGSMVWRPMR